ncbi:MAG: radical SAM protein [Nitrososphaeria archaeon]|nr:radical SAM protein [Nitrososphaeria archaeon]
MHYRVVKPFDPWKKGSLCTCPFKYTINPYTGCSHSCLYCYASAYIKDFFNPRKKDRLLEYISKDIKYIPEGSIINISSSSDPYIPLEKEINITRNILEKFVDRNYIIEIVTKSDLVIRDIDLLCRGRSIISITITTLNEELAKILEPGAPSPLKRIDAIKKLSENSLPVVLRFDPIMPFITDSEENIENVIEEAVDAGARHVVSSTYKVKWDNLERIVSRFPSLSKNFKELYFVQGEKIHGALYAPKGYREKILSKVREKVKIKGLTFSTCRENLSYLNDKEVSCDGTSICLKKLS